MGRIQESVRENNGMNVEVMCVWEGSGGGGLRMSAGTWELWWSMMMEITRGTQCPVSSVSRLN